MGISEAPRHFEPREELCSAARSSAGERAGLILGTMLALLLAMIQAHAGDSSAERMISLARPLVIGHRGFNVFAPENTLPSFEMARRAGADLVELDYHVSRDGVPIVIHDGTLDRTTDAVQRWGGQHLRVADKTVAELKTLDAGTWFDPQFSGTRLPTLGEALDIIQRGGGMTLIERKAGSAEECIRLLRERGLVNEVVVQAFDWEFLKRAHELAPEQILGALGPPGSLDGKKLTDEEKVLDSEWIEAAQRAGASVLGWNRQVTREAVLAAHEKKMKVWVYTIDKPEEAELLLDMGVDGIITDNTSLIWRAAALRAERLGGSK